MCPACLQRRRRRWFTERLLRRWPLWRGVADSRRLMEFVEQRHRRFHEVAERGGFISIVGPTNRCQEFVESFFQERHDECAFGVVEKNQYVHSAHDGDPLPRENSLLSRSPMSMVSTPTSATAPAVICRSVSTPMNAVTRSPPRRGSMRTTLAPPTSAHRLSQWVSCIWHHSCFSLGKE